MKKVLAIVALVAAMFVAGQTQAQTTIYAGYAPETFVNGNNNTNYQGFFAGFSKNFGLSKGIGVAAGAQFRMNTKNYDFIYVNHKDTQVLVDVPILFNYGIGINRDISITPFVGPMASLALVGNTKNSTGTYDWYSDNFILGFTRPNSRFNLYAVFGADVKFNQFNLFAGYRLGLLDLNSKDNITMKANGFFVGLGFSL